LGEVETFKEKNQFIKQIKFSQLPRTLSVGHEIQSELVVPEQSKHEISQQINDALLKN
jgi:hypothetical protein